MVEKVIKIPKDILVDLATLISVRLDERLWFYEIHITSDNVTSEEPDPSHKDCSFQRHSLHRLRNSNQENKNNFNSKSCKGRILCFLCLFVFSGNWSSPCGIRREKRCISGPQRWSETPSSSITWGSSNGTSTEWKAKKHHQVQSITDCWLPKKVLQ